MGDYPYVARNRSGKTIKGKISAKTEVEARAMLRLMGMNVTSFGSNDDPSLVKRYGPIVIKPGGQIEIKLGGKPRVKGSDLAVFTKQLSVMIDAGVSIVQGLDMLAKTTSNETMKEALVGVREGVEGGLDLAAAMAKHPYAFDSLYCSLVEAGQSSGQLDVMMKRLSTYIEKAEKLRKQLVSALSYPVIILVLAVAMTTLMLLFVVPMFAKNYEDSGRALPALTQMVIDASKQLQENFHIIAAVVFVVGFLFKKWKQTPAGQRQWDAIMLKLPVFGNLIKKIALARFASTMGTLVASGISIIEALQVCSKAAGNHVIATDIIKIRDAVEQGKGLAAPMAQLPLFPPMFQSMVSIGEASGRLDSMMEKVASFYEDDVDSAMAAALKMIEPAMFVLIGGIVGFILIAMYLPVFDMANNV